MKNITLFAMLGLFVSCGEKTGGEGTEVGDCTDGADNDGDGDFDYDSNLTIHATDVISSNEIHGTIFGSFSANSGWWECSFKDEPSTVILTQ